MDRRMMIGYAAALALGPWRGARAADEAGATVNPKPRKLYNTYIKTEKRLNVPMLPIELIPRLGIDRALGAQLAIRYMPSGVLALEDIVAGNGHFAGEVAYLADLFGQIRADQDRVRRHTAAQARHGRHRLAFGDKTRQHRETHQGHSIGLPLGSPTARTYLETVMEIWLSSNGVARGDVRWVQTNQNLDGMYGSLAGGVVDAVFCEEPLAGTLVRKKIGVRLANLGDPKAPGRAVWANHLRAILAAPRDLLANHPKRAELMIGMLQRSLQWIRTNKPAEIVARLGIQDAELAQDLTDPLKKMPNLYSPDGRFKPAELDATRAFLVASGTPLPANMAITDLIADQWVK